MSGRESYMRTMRARKMHQDYMYGPKATLGFPLKKGEFTQMSRLKGQASASSKRAKITLPKLNLPD